VRALVLAGGTGTRLRPFTHSMPKQLVPVANKPVLVHVLENIRDLGITEVGMVVGDREDQLRAVIGDGSQLGLDIVYLRQDHPRGLAHGVLIARDFLGDEDFLMYLGDNMLVGGLHEAAAAFRDSGAAASVVVVKVDDPRQFGVAEIDPDGRVTAVVEKPQHPASNLALTGAYFFSAAIHEAVRGITPSRRGELEITDAIQYLVERDRLVTAERYNGYWKDTGNADDLLECNRLLLDGQSALTLGEVDARSRLTGRVVVEPGARVIGSRLIGPVTIGAGSVISHSTVGPYTSVGRDCTLVAAGIAGSIVFDGASVTGVTDIDGSLIGRGADIRSGGAEPSHRLLVGDHTRIVMVASNTPTTRGNPMPASVFTLDDLLRIMRACAGQDESVQLDGDITELSFAEIGYDSLALLETATWIERDYGLSLPEEDIQRADTPGMLMDLVNGLLLTAA
jgi:glucose-1-phosphate thymidylyltransferase